MEKIRYIHQKVRKKIERSHVLEWRKALCSISLQIHSAYAEQKSEDTNEQDRCEKAKNFRERSNNIQPR